MEPDWNTEERIPVLRMLTPADWISLSNGFLGLLSIGAAAGGHFRTAFTLILLAALLDGVDGAVSRLGWGGGRLGQKLDTLSDLVSFVVAPAYLIWSTFGGVQWIPQLTGDVGRVAQSAAVLVVVALYFGSGVLRLARFDYLRGGDRHDYFLGITTPAGGAVLASLALLHWEVPWTLAIVAAVALLMASRIRLPKLRGSLAPAAGLVILTAATFGNTSQNLGPMLLLVCFVAYLLLGPGYVRRHFDLDEPSAAL